jgi:hypothetical protein
MITLPDMLRDYSIAQLLDFADSLDPNNGWRESISEDDSITRDSLCWSMLLAYDDADTHVWINKPKQVKDKISADQVQKILQLLQKAQALGLNFDIGSAYIRRSYIDEQTALNAEIDTILKDFK